MRHNDKIEEKRRLARLHEETKTRYGAGAFFDERRGCFVRYSVTGKRGKGKFFRNLGNRKVRQSEEVPPGCGYKKVYDYLWNLI